MGELRLVFGEEVTSHTGEKEWIPKGERETSQHPPPDDRDWRQHGGGRRD